MPRVWSSGEYHVQPNNAGTEFPASLTERIYELACRSTFDTPGFCLVDVGPEGTSELQRRWMIELHRELSAVHERRTGRRIGYVSLARFDQQVTTKPHRDGGPDESLLVLGYEPTDVESSVSLLDYAACAHEMGITPAEFLERHNPMFTRGAELLAGWTSPVASLSHSSYQILVINNSQASFDPRGERWQGVLHTASIPNPDDSRSRVVNSMMLASVTRETPDAVTPEQVQRFLTMQEVRRRGYTLPETEE